MTDDRTRGAAAAPMAPGAGDRFRVLGRALAAAWRVPGKRKIPFLVNPVDATRYQEFAILLGHIRRNRPELGRVLDVSSPVIMAHILGGLGASVVKTDLDPAEGRHVGRGRRVRFCRTDSRALPFRDGCFDLVYCISVIEHIHVGYIEAVREMVRVAGPGGLLYITFPVAGGWREEWLDRPLYSGQARRGDRYFFQHRFDESGYLRILGAASAGCRVLLSDIYWERRPGLYEDLVRRLRADLGSRVLNLAKSALLNYAVGPGFFEACPSDFTRAGAFGNAHLLLHKEPTA